MSFNLFQQSYGFNVGVQTPLLAAGGPSGNYGVPGDSRDATIPYPYVVNFFGVLQGLPYGRAQSNASPVPWNNRYAKPITFRLFGGLQKAPTYSVTEF